MVEVYVPQRGDIVWLQFNPQAGHEQSGKRPALVISPHIYNEKTGLMLACPITSRIKGYPFEVLIPDSIPIHGVVLADQIKSLDWRARNCEFAYKAPIKVTEDVVNKIQLLISS